VNSPIIGTVDPLSPGDTERAPRLSTKPLRADAQRNRQRVLAAAQEAFAEEGLAVPLDDIARRAGVGAGTVYRHFPTKEALFEAVILDRVRQFATHAKTLTSADDPGAAFFSFLRLLIEGHGKNRDLVDALAAQLDNANLIAKAKQDLVQAGVVILNRAQQAGAVRLDVGIAEVFVLLTAAAWALREQGGDGELVFEVILDGLRPRPR
jgi:AcrR family transcriptional regulator